MSIVASDKIMEKKIYSEPQIQILEIDVEDTMVNKTSTLHDQNQIVANPTTIGRAMPTMPLQR